MKFYPSLTLKNLVQNFWFGAATTHHGSERIRDGPGPSFFLLGEGVLRWALEQNFGPVRLRALLTLNFSKYSLKNVPQFLPNLRIRAQSGSLQKQKSLPDRNHTFFFRFGPCLTLDMEYPCPTFFKDNQMHLIVFKKVGHNVNFQIHYLDFLPFVLIQGLPNYPLYRESHKVSHECTPKITNN